VNSKLVIRNYSTTYLNLAALCELGSVQRENSKPPQAVSTHCLPVLPTYTEETQSITHDWTQLA